MQATLPGAGPRTTCGSRFLSFHLVGPRAVRLAGRQSWLTSPPLGSLLNLPLLSPLLCPFLSPPPPFSQFKVDVTQIFLIIFLISSLIVLNPVPEIPSLPSPTCLNPPSPGVDLSPGWGPWYFCRSCDFKTGTCFTVEGIGPELWPC